MSSAENAAQVFMRDVAWQWSDLAEARANFSWLELGPASPVAEIDGGGEPSRCLSLKEFNGFVILPPGPPRMVANVWLCYPNRRHAITAGSNTLLVDRDENPAFGIGTWLSMAVDPDERDSDGLVEPVRPADRVPLVVDGIERETWYYANGGLCCRAVRMEEMYYAAICPAGEARDTRLVTR